MFLSLGAYCIQLETHSPEVRHLWKRLYGRLLQEKADKPIAAIFDIAYVPESQPAPEGTPYFVSNKIVTGGIRMMQAYRQPNNHILLYFLEGGSITLPVGDGASPTQPMHLKGIVSERMMRRARIDDLINLPLASLLRPRAHFMIHGAAVRKDDHAILLVGKPKSGKTTTWLSLMLDGWLPYSNDLVLLQNHADGVFALPMPDRVVVREETKHLLPEIEGMFSAETPSLEPTIAYSTPSTRLFKSGLAEPAPIKAIFFTEIDESETTSIKKQLRAVSLARLLERSIDQWDEHSIANHTAFLSQFSQSTPAYQLKLGRDIENISDILGSVISE